MRVPMAAPQMPLPFSTAQDAAAAGDADLAPFHPLVQRWFRTRLGAPSAPQR